MGGGDFKADLRAFLGNIREHLAILVIVILAYVGNYALNLVLANMLYPTDYGDIAVVLQLLVIFAPFVLFGTELSVVRFLPKYLEDKDYPKVQGFLRWAFEVFVGFTALILLLSSILVFISMIVQEEGTAFARWHIWIYSIWLIPLYAVTIVLANILQSLKKFTLSASFDGMKGHALTLLMAGMLFLFWWIVGSRWIGVERLRFLVVFIMALAMIIIAGVEVILCKRYLPKEVWEVHAVLDRKHWFSMSFKMVTSTVVFAGMISMAFILLELIHTKGGEVGHFASVVTIASSIMVIGWVVDILVNPIIYPSIESGDMSHLQSTLNSTNFFKILPGIIFLLVIVFFGKDLLTHFGKGFVNGYPSLIVLACGFLIGLCFNTSGALLLYSHHQKENLFISLGQLIFLIVGDLICIPLFGLFGAAAVLAVSIVLSSLAQAHLVRKHLKIKTFFFL
ncbi:MAG: hypothetical protein SP1CHLAM54_14610 [Chlamydiia bacterium]|nr:hypothetical protein [Chlamydiia bacterium]MCH9616352.1 hypothetical protein [Chlamydiia bacterium]MCH9629662.1 hypothetical protein [Chlamydiia bacterium]